MPNARARVERAFPVTRGHRAYRRGRRIAKQERLPPERRRARR